MRIHSARHFQLLHVISTQFSRDPSQAAVFTSLVAVFGCVFHPLPPCGSCFVQGSAFWPALCAGAGVFDAVTMAMAAARAAAPHQSNLDAMAHTMSPKGTSLAAPIPSNRHCCATTASLVVASRGPLPVYTSSLRCPLSLLRVRTTRMCGACVCGATGEFSGQISPGKGFKLPANAVFPAVG